MNFFFLLFLDNTKSLFTCNICFEQFTPSACQINSFLLKYFQENNKGKRSKSEDNEPAIDSPDGSDGITEDEHGVCVSCSKEVKLIAVCSECAGCICDLCLKNHRQYKIFREHTPTLKEKNSHLRDLIQVKLQKLNKCTEPGHESVRL